MLLDDLPVAAAEMHRIRQLGVKVSVDDFGTGYTSLAHLQHLPVDSIKIDRSFINELGHSKDAALVRMITELGHHLGVGIVSEGVETIEQLDAVRRIGSDQAQG